MQVSEAKTIISDLDKATDTKAIVELLTVLKDKVQATEQFLRKTKVGVAVNKLRSNEDPEVSALVKKIIKQWKDEVSKEKHKKRAAAVKKSAPAPAPVVSTKPRTPASDGVKLNYHDNSTRNGSISGLYTALAMGSTVDSEIIAKVAKDIEAAAYKVNDEKVEDKYRTKMRSLIMNLRNKKNPELRTRVVQGDIEPARFVAMTNEELAPESLKKVMQDMHEQNLFNAQGAVQKRAVTDRLVCGRCKKREVSYYQMQTRSADEPLTTFCTCEHCGNRWKFC